ncbi:MAG: serine/threonine protein kinase, partial [Myxococcales bacterium]|nr:serine/threonine protein kinase [Myxococcales bacterium]
DALAMDVADDSQELLAALERGKPEMHDPVAQDILDEVRRAALGVGSTPRQFGRFTVLERVAGGGMGVVYAAFDPKLSRKVAIKVLRDQGDARRRRLLREARTLARLSHPNVVAIHDVGEREGSVWLAMEFVEGVTLSAWLRAERRTWRAALEVMEAAGRGLAAAHAAGLLHRDFKPDNVMVGNDGRVRVMDLGLARASEDEPVPTVSHDLAARGESGKLAIRVTQAGAVLGTPAYMAPELFRGGDADARADVFAYCVTLWEALYGQRPFAGASMVRLAANVLAGKLEAPPRDPASRRVPRWLRRVCERGLALDPERRYASMPALLATFERGLGRARLGRSFAGIAALALVVGGALGWSRWDEHQRRAACERDGAEIDAVWNDERRRALREGLLATGVPYAATAAAKTSHYLDAQAKRWRAVRTGVCLETRVAGTWTEELLARASWCLEERKMELEALAAELTRANATTVQKAVMAAAGLNDVEPCRKGPRLRLLPGPPAEGSGVAAVDQELSHAGALLAAGDYQQGLEVAREALSRAEAVGWP